MAKYSIRAVATKTGLNAATLRTWERRYNAVSPERQPNGSRQYTEAGLRRVHLLKRATELGHPIRNLSVLDDATLEQLVGSAGTSAVTEPAGAALGCVELLLNSVDAMDLAVFERLVATAALAFPPDLLVEAVLRPVLEQIGERWSDGRLSIASEHAVSASLSGVLLALIKTYPQTGNGAPIVIGSLPGERHELALLIVRFMLASMSVPVVYLGPDLPADEIMRVATHYGSRAIALTAIHGEDLVQQREHLRRLLQGLSADTEVWIGGAFNQRLAEGISDPRVRCFRSYGELQQRAWIVGSTKP